MVNEFENLDTDKEEMETFSESESNNEMVAQGSAGQLYDWTQAPEGIKAPPRIDLNGKTVTIKKADIVLPPKDKKWDLTKAGDKEYKYCTFVLHYDFEGQQEFYAGVRVFKREEDKYSHPTITRDRKSQASKLLGLYADFKEKDINEISLREFMGFLNSNPKVKIKVGEVENPVTNETIKKNFVGSFIK